MASYVIGDSHGHHSTAGDPGGYGVSMLIGWRMVQLVWADIHRHSRRFCGSETISLFANCPVVDAATGRKSTKENQGKNNVVWNVPFVDRRWIRPTVVATGFTYLSWGSELFMSHALFTKFLVDLRASYWFIPSLMVFSAILLSLLTIWMDAKVSSDWTESVSFLFSSQPDGARALLSTVAGSMITVAGVTFSLTLLAVSHSTGHFGPRVLSNFMRDRGNQVTLGTFISTFIYCLMILRTVRSSEEPPAGKTVEELGGDLAVAFVPQISLTVALVLTLCSVGVLIYFIHHIPESIRLSNVVSGIGRRLQKSIEELFPEMISAGQAPARFRPKLSDLPDDFFENSVSVDFNHSGYVQALDDRCLMRIANENDLVVFISRRPGDFHCEGKELVRVYPAENYSEQIRDQLRSVFAMGVHRTHVQNVMFSVDQLVEIAQRALSPGVNDPMTATYCMDWLQTALVNLTRRDEPPVLQYNEEGTLRLFAPTVRFKDFCDRIFDQLRQYVAADRNASLHMMGVINEIRDSANSAEQQAVLDCHAERLIEAFEIGSVLQDDLDELRRLNTVGQNGVSCARQKFESVFA